MKNRSKVLLLVLISICFTFSLHASTITREFRREVDFDPGGEVRVRNVNEQISVKPWDRNSVEIYAEIEVKAGSRRDAEEFMKRVEILVDEQRGRLSVEADYPKIRGGDGIWDWIFGKKPQVKIEFWIRVPSETDLDLKSVNGGVLVEDVEGRAELRTTNGKIDADGMRGSVSAYTTNGGIRVVLSRVEPNHKMSFHTTNGGIKLYLPDDIEADIDASTTNGSISTDFPLEVRGKYNRKRIRGRINGGGGLIDLHTTNGSIRLYEE